MVGSLENSVSYKRMEGYFAMSVLPSRSPWTLGYPRVWTLLCVVILERTWRASAVVGSVLLSVSNCWNSSTPFANFRFCVCVCIKRNHDGFGCQRWGREKHLLCLNSFCRLLIVFDVQWCLICIVWIWTNRSRIVRLLFFFNFILKLV